MFDQFKRNHELNRTNQFKMDFNAINHLTK
jgi:hypothetical protein